MKRVLVGGTFDILHYGHIKFLKNAKSYGDYLIAIVSSDSLIGNKKRLIHNESERAEVLSNLKIVDKVIIGDSKNPYKGYLDAGSPDIIYLEYDQELPFSREKLDKNVKIIRGREHSPDKYKSSFIKQRIYNEFNEILSLIDIAYKNVNRCPWVLERNKSTFIKGIKDEIEEVELAIEKKDRNNLIEEAGDVLWNSLNLIYILERDENIKSNQIFRGITEKIMRRKPHLLNGTKITAKEAEEQWKNIKKEEKKTRDI